MKNLIQSTLALFLLAQTAGYSQTKTVETNSDQVATSLKKKSTNTETETETQDTNSFLGTYFLAEADFELEIVEEDNKMYIISPFSKDILIQTNKTTVHEPTRGVDLELIAKDKNALKYTQNGYETIIKRVKSKTTK